VVEVQELDVLVVEEVEVVLVVDALILEIGTSLSAVSTF
jgi:hypothetical protein